jgi:hypothetical protein
MRISDLQKHMDKAIHFIQNIGKYWISGNLDVKKRIQKLVFQGGFYIDPVNRQYLTNKVNSLFRLNVELSRSSEDGGKFPAEKSEESVSVHYSDEISDRGIMKDFVKVVDSIELSNITDQSFKHLSEMRFSITQDKEDNNSIVIEKHSFHQ